MLSPGATKSGLISQLYVGPRELNDAMFSNLFFGGRIGPDIPSVTPAPLCSTSCLRSSPSLPGRTMAGIVHPVAELAMSTLNLSGSYQSCRYAMKPAASAVIICCMRSVVRQLVQRKITTLSFISAVLRIVLHRSTGFATTAARASREWSPPEGAEMVTSARKPRMRELLQCVPSDPPMSTCHVQSVLLSQKSPSLVASMELSMGSELSDNAAPMETQFLAFVGLPRVPLPSLYVHVLPFESSGVFASAPSPSFPAANMGRNLRLFQA
mmetsp:Transcript_2344/g.9062  ORF Transcript_2344/g.9062 Transcript_2344/m.9062 type:complete len:268 (+) Transcript_2344:819-1622(+)